MSAVIDGHQQAKRLRALYGPPSQKPNAPTAANGRGIQGVAGERSPNPNTTSLKLPRNWRDRVSSPAHFYANALPDLADLDDTGISVATCPLHSEPTTARLTVNLATSRGCWQCSVCGQGDMVAFVMRLHRIGFVAAVRHLVMEVAK